MITLPFNLERNRREAGFEELEHKISQRYDPSDFVDSQPPDEAQVPNSIPGHELAIVTLLGEPTVRAYSEYEVYDKMSKLTMPSIQRYADRWGHPLLMMPNHMIDKSKQAYWAKIPLMEHYLDQGFKYVLYTDIDVLFLKHEVPLSSFLVPGKDIIGVNECVRRNETSNAIRSGFMLLRNSNKTLNFLKLWRESFPYFQQMENPEQSALEFLVRLPQFASMVHLHSWQTFHSYDTCDGYQSAFSMHFPGAHKLSRLGRTVSWFSFHQPSMTLNPPEQYFAYNLTVADLHLGIVPSESATNDVAAQRVTSCFTILQGQGYTLKDSQYNKQQHIDILGYNMASIHFNIPTVIYLSMPNTTFMPEKVAANVQAWRESQSHHRALPTTSASKPSSSPTWRSQ